jgi:hypothetical protein
MSTAQYSRYLNMSSIAVLLKSRKAVSFAVQRRGSPILDVRSGKGHIYSMSEDVFDVAKKRDWRNLG